MKIKERFDSTVGNVTTKEKAQEIANAMNKNTEITPKRARELRMLCSPFAFMDDRCKEFKPQTDGERKRVKEIWNKNPNGLSSYFSTLCEIEHGRTKG